MNQLAEMSASSPSAVHRYESGWGSFELRTLKRLATALSARVEIRLVPARAAEEELPSPMKLVKQLQPLFWDVQLTKEHLDANTQWVLRRVLQFGGWRDVHAVRRMFGDDAIREAAAHRSTDPRTRRLWEVVLASKESSS